jgi:hypothetical protein
MIQSKFDLIFHQHSALAARFAAAAYSHSRLSSRFILRLRYIEGEDLDLETFSDFLIS